MKDRYEEYISPSQSAYRQSRSTVDIVQTHRWLTAKIQKVEAKVHLSGIDMSSAFETINREHLLNIIKSNFDENVYRMIGFFFSNTTVEVRLRGATTSSFTSNIRSTQDDRISGILFNIYLEDALRRAMTKVVQNNPQIEHSYTKVKKVSLSREMIYADDTDILSTDVIKKIRVLYAICEVFPERNLHINSDKELWREVKKLESLLGGKEDITRRKQLSIAAVNNIEKVWIRKDYISEKYRLKLCRTFVKPVLIYENATWGLTKQDTIKFHSFHSQQVRRLIVNWKKLPQQSLKQSSVRTIS